MMVLLTGSGPRDMVSLYVKPEIIPARYLNITAGPRCWLGEGMYFAKFPQFVQSGPGTTKSGLPIEKTIISFFQE